MRILVVSDLPQFVMGGVETQVSRLCEAWLSAGHEVICLGKNFRGSHVFIGGYRVRVGRIWVTQRLGRAGRAISYFISLAAWLVRLRFWADIIYVRFLGDAAVTASVLSSILLVKAPIVAVPAGAGPHGDMSYLRSIPLSASLVQLLDRSCAAINLIAPAMKDDLELAGFRKTKMHRIPNGIPIRALERFEGSRSGPLKLIAVGRLHRQKGFDLLLEALSQSQLRSRDFLLEIIGDGPEQSCLFRMAQDLCLESKVIFLGKMAHDAIRKRLQQADIFILPSRFEGMSNAALEAMECSLPLIVTRCGGIDQWIGSGNGWVAECDDALSLATSLCEAMELSRECLLEIGKVNRQLVEGEFDMRVVAARYLELFKSISK